VTFSAAACRRDDEKETVGIVPGCNALKVSFLGTRVLFTFDVGWDFTFSIALDVPPEATAWSGEKLSNRA